VKKWKWRVDSLKEEGRSGGSEARATKNISRSGISLWCAAVRSAALRSSAELLGWPTAAEAAVSSWSAWPTCHLSRGAEQQSEPEQYHLHRES
jgi:hypothetical protein